MKQKVITPKIKQCYCGANATKQCVKIALEYSHYTKQQRELILNEISNI